MLKLKFLKKFPLWLKGGLIGVLLNCVLILLYFLCINTSAGWSRIACVKSSPIIFIIDAYPNQFLIGLRDLVENSSICCDGSIYYPWIFDFILLSTLGALIGLIVKLIGLIVQKVKSKKI